MIAECQALVAEEKQAGRNVAKACEPLDVPRSAFYVRLPHTPSARELSDAELTETSSSKFRDVPVDAADAA